MGKQQSLTLKLYSYNIFICLPAYIRACMCVCVSACEGNCGGVVGLHCIANSQLLLPLFGRQEGRKEAVGAQSKRYVA